MGQEPDRLNAHELVSPSSRQPRQAATDANHFVLTFENNRIAGELFGQFDQNLKLLEQRLNIDARPRGNSVAITGDVVATRLTAQKVNSAPAADDVGAAKAPDEIIAAQAVDDIRLIGAVEAAQPRDTIIARATDDRGRLTRTSGWTGKRIVGADIASLYRSNLPQKPALVGNLTRVAAGTGLSGTSPIYNDR